MNERVVVIAQYILCQNNALITLSMYLVAQVVASNNMWTDLSWFALSYRRPHRPGACQGLLGVVCLVADKNRNTFHHPNVSTTAVIGFFYTRVFIAASRTSRSSYESQLNSRFYRASCDLLFFSEYSQIRFNHLRQRFYRKTLAVCLTDSARRRYLLFILKVVDLAPPLAHKNVRESQIIVATSVTCYDNIELE